MRRIIRSNAAAKRSRPHNAGGGWKLEVNRLCTDGTRNACSMLYAAAWRAARAMGYKKLITYILESEPGTSLKAAGWKGDQRKQNGIAG